MVRNVPAQPLLIRSGWAREVSRTFGQESERSGWNISVMAMELLFQVAEKVENHMLRNSNCKVTEAVIFQPNLSISLRLRGPFIRKKGRRH